AVRGPLPPRQPRPHSFSEIFSRILAAAVDLTGGRSTIGCSQHPTGRGKPMQYLLLIYENENNRGNIDRAKLVEDYGKFTKSIIESGNFKAGDGLQPTSTATTVRLKDGKPVTT